MTELSLYRLLAASPGDFLELVVTKAPGVARDEPGGSKQTYENRGREQPHGPGLASSPVLTDSPTSIRCSNCRRQGHSVRDCIGPVNEAGEIDGCPKCNTAGLHLYDSCPLRRASEDLDFIYRYRQRKPPLKSAMTWASFLAADHGGRPGTTGDWPRYLPWSGRFAWEEHHAAAAAAGRTMPPDWLHYEYEDAGWPEVEAARRPSDPYSEFLVL